MARPSKGSASQPTSPGPATPSPAPEPEVDDVCMVCAEKVEIYAIGTCNHPICHKCSLRLRELYKKRTCIICKADNPLVIFTDDGTRSFQSFGEREYAVKDDALGIAFQYKDMSNDARALLRFNCPELTCDAVASSWPSLAKHTRTVHHQLLCEICTHNKHVFPHEHTMFSRKALASHYAGTDEAEIAKSGFRGHPLCGFCGQRFYDDEALYVHCRDKHEQCFLCVRELGSLKSPWYENYHTLSKHFARDHFACQERECLEQKFIVFPTDIDLKAHQNFEHGVVGAGQRAAKNKSRQINLDFHYDSHADSHASSSSSHRGEGGGRRGGRGGERGGDRGQSRGQQQASSQAHGPPSRGQGRAQPQAQFVSETGADISNTRPTGIALSVVEPPEEEEPSSTAAGGRLGAPEGFGRLSAKKGRGRGKEAKSGSSSSTTPAAPLDERAQKFCQDVILRARAHIPPSLTDSIHAELASMYGIKQSAATFIDSVVELLLPHLQHRVSGSSLDLVQAGKRAVGAIIKACIVQLGVSDDRAVELNRAWNEHIAIISQFPELQSSDFYTSSTLGRPSTPSGGADTSTWGGGDHVLSVKKEATAHTSSGIWQRVAAAAAGAVVSTPQPTHGGRPGLSMAAQLSMRPGVSGGVGGSLSSAEAFPSLSASAGPSSSRSSPAPLSERDARGKKGGKGGTQHSTAWSSSSQGLSSVSSHPSSSPSSSPSYSAYPAPSSIHAQSPSAPSPPHGPLQGGANAKGKARAGGDFPSLPVYTPPPRILVGIKKKKEEPAINAWGVTPSSSHAASASPPAKQGKGKGRKVVLRIG